MTTIHCAISMYVRESDLDQVLRKNIPRLINSMYKGQEVERTVENHAARIQTGLGQRREREVGSCKALEAT